MCRAAATKCVTSNPKKKTCKLTEGSLNSGTKKKSGSVIRVHQTGHKRVFLLLKIISTKYKCFVLF